MKGSQTQSVADAFLDELRQRTGACHKALEANPCSEAILKPEVSLADYQYYLGAMYGMKKAVEDQVYPMLKSLLPDIESREKSALIITDLRHTGYKEEQLEQIPVYDFGKTDTAAALGIMYVLEGSTLGGRVLYKHINKVLGFDEGNGASYFCGYGSETATKWRSFLAVLCSYAEEQDASNEIISSAIHCFTKMDLWLSGTRSTVA